MRNTFILCTAIFFAAATFIAGLVFLFQPVYSTGMDLYLGSDVFFVGRVARGSVAAEAGIARGDRIRSVDGRQMRLLYELSSGSLPEYLRVSSRLFVEGTTVSLGMSDGRRLELPVGDAPFLVRLQAADRVILSNFIVGIVLPMLGAGFMISRKATDATLGFFVFCLTAGPALGMSYFHTLWTYEFIQFRFVMLGVFSISATISLVWFASSFPERFPCRVRVLAGCIVIPLVYLAIILYTGAHYMGPAHFFVHGYAVVGIAVGILLLFIQYRQASTGKRRRLKWVFFGIATSIVPFMLFLLTPVFRGDVLETVHHGLFNQIAVFSVLLFPVSAGFGLTWHTIVDIDDVLSDVLVFMVLGFIVAVAAWLFRVLTESVDQRLFYLLLIGSITVLGRWSHNRVSLLVDSYVHARRIRGQQKLNQYKQQLLAITNRDDALHRFETLLSYLFDPESLTVQTDAAAGDLTGAYRTDDGLRIVMRAAHAAAAHIVLVGPRRDEDMYSRSDVHLVTDAVEATERAIHGAEYLESIVHALDVERQLSADKDQLLQEVHHRVKNNLQIVESLLNLQIQSEPDSEVGTRLAGIRERVHVMAMVHEGTYHSADFDRIEMDRYLASVITCAQHSAQRKEVRVHRDLTPVVVPVAVALPCGLMLVELVANAIRHGIAAGARSGDVSVRFRPTETGQLELSVSDPGPGIDSLADIDDAHTGGFLIIQAMAAQLQARIELKHERNAFLIVVRIPINTRNVKP